MVLYKPTHVFVVSCIYMHPTCKSATNDEVIYFVLAHSYLKSNFTIIMTGVDRLWRNFQCLYVYCITVAL